MHEDGWLYRATLSAIEPWRRYVRPVFFGLADLPAPGPAIFVGNHTLLGILDVPIMVGEVWRRRGIALRALGDHTHFQIPGWRDVLARYGAVDGRPENAARLLEEGEALLVFPGGAREVTKRKGEKYRLVWKERRGFARLAMAHRVPIVPFAAVGAEEAFDIVLDGDEILASAAGPLLRELRVREDLIFPVVKGRGRSPVPRRARFYFRFGAPIHPDDMPGPDDDAKVVALRRRAEASVKESLGWLRRVQALDPESGLVAPAHLDD